ncbi:MAG TPA: hypothetical protein VJN32_06110 [Dehalococcoidia bacterium]|nr:hypothetical protein [Dehalococcoidia bacterium]
MGLKLPESGRARIGLAVAGVVAAVAGITLGVTTLLGVTFQGTGEAQQRDASMTKKGALTTANRDRLAICVQAVGVDSSLEGKAKASVEAALIEVAKHPRWDASGLGVAPPIADTGCPSPPSVLRPGVEIEQMGKGRIFVLPFPCVEEASYYRLFVFILPPAELERIFGEDYEQTLSQQEAFCGGQYGNMGVTGGLYLTPADLDDTQLLAEKLKRAVGLWYPTRW